MSSRSSRPNSTVHTIGHRELRPLPGVREPTLGVPLAATIDGATCSLSSTPHGIGQPGLKYDWSRATVTGTASRLGRAKAGRRCPVLQSYWRRCLQASPAIGLVLLGRAPLPLAGQRLTNRVRVLPCEGLYRAVSPTVGPELTASAGRSTLAAEAEVLYTPRCALPRDSLTQQKKERDNKSHLLSHSPHSSPNASGKRLWSGTSTARPSERLGAPKCTQLHPRTSSGRLEAARGVRWMACVDVVEVCVEASKLKARGKGVLSHVFTRSRWISTVGLDGQTQRTFVGL